MYAAFRYCRSQWPSAVWLGGMLFFAWGMTVQMAADFEHQAGEWADAPFWPLFAMWAIMMAAMMLPSAWPMVSVYRRHLARQGRAATMACGMMAVGYLGAWTLFSVALAALQGGLHDWGALEESRMALPASWQGGLLLIGAGLYQLSPLKQACWRYCKSPVLFLLTHWRRGRLGALVMGLHNGLFCLGCCWLLMLLLFVGGVMNLLWIAALTVFVLLEKTAPLPPRWSGAALIVWGALSLGGL